MSAPRPAPGPPPPGREWSSHAQKPVPVQPPLAPPRGSAIALDMSSGIPPYEQIRSQLGSLIASGALTPGSRLPTVRNLAADLGVAVGTVTRAYRELEAAGAVHSRRRTGTVVAHNARLGSSAVQSAVARLVAAARTSGMPDDDVLTLVRGALLSARRG